MYLNYQYPVGWSELLFFDRTEVGTWQLAGMILEVQIQNFGVHAHPSTCAPQHMRVTVFILKKSRGPKY